MTLMEKLREQWMWDPDLLRFWQIIFGVMSVSITAVTWPVLGTNSLYFLLLSLGGVLEGAIYGAVNRKLGAVRDSIPDGTGEMADSLMLIGAIQSPGIAVLNDDELILYPIVRDTVTLKLDEIKSVRVKSNMYGKGFIWKRALIPETGDKRRIAFALPPSIAERWVKRLSRPGNRDT